MAQKQNGHLTIEQLSALMDKQLSTQEAAQSEAHLRHCQQCQGTLNDLRQTVALLHALPQPTLPRSFVLSPEMLAAPSQEAAVPAPIQIEERRQQRQQERQVLRTPERSRRSVMPRTLRVMSTLVALVGFIFLVSALPFGGSANNSGTATSSSSNSPVATVTPSPTAQHNAVTKPSATQGATSTQTPQLTTHHSTSSGSPASGSASTPAPFTQGGRAIDGLLLLVLALLGLVIARRWRVRGT